MEKKDKCCTPKGQVSRYVDCVGCDKKPIEGATLSYAQAQKDSFSIMEKKQSSIHWYENKLIQLDIDFGGHKNYWIERKKVREQAKAMHKEEVQDAYRISPNNELWSNSGIDYYNETFGGEKE